MPQAFVFPEKKAVPGFWDMFTNPGTAFFLDKKNACGNTHSESNAQKYTITHTEKHLDKYTKSFGQIHKNIWKHTQTHLDKYTRTFGNIHYTLSMYLYLYL